MKVHRKLHRAGWVATTLAILALPCFWYLSAERLRLDEAHSRELAHLATGLETTIAGQIDAAKKFFQSDPPKKPSTTESSSFAKRNPYIQDVVAGTLPEQGKQVCAAATPTELFVWSAKDEPELHRFALNGRKILNDVALDDAFEYVFIAEAGWADKDVDNAPVAAGKKPEERGGNTGEPKADASGPVTDDARGNVVLSMVHGTFSSHWRDLGFLRRRALETSDAQQSVIGLKDIKGVIDENSQQPLNVSALARSSGRYSVRVGDDTYQLFSYPITVLRPRPGAGECGVAEYRWIVGGLVNPSRTWREAATIAPHSTLVIAIVLLLIVALQPLIKLYFLNPVERFRFADACMLTANATLVLMATTVLLLENGAYSNLRKSADTGLETLAGVVENNLIKEFGSMRAELLNFTNYFKICDVSPTYDLSAMPVSEREFPVSLQAYPELGQVTWIDPQGSQIFKITTNPKSTPRISVRGRPYFTEASYRMPKNLWSFANEDESSERTPPFFVQSTRSWTTAELSTDLSISLRNRTNLSNRTGNCDGYVAEISAPLLTAERPILADGYEFAVISANGQVLYHSDPRRTLKENLLVEIEDADAVHAAMQSGTRKLLKTMYGGRATDLFIRPFSVRNSGWFLVTMRDRGWIYSVATEALFQAGALCCLSWLVSTLFLLPLLRAGKSGLRHIWPTPGKESFYRQLTAMYIVLTAAGIAVVLALNPAGGSLTWFSLSFPLAVGATTLLMHRLNLGVPVPSQAVVESSASRTYWVWYVTALTALWVSAGTVPAAGIFLRCWHLELHKLEEFEQKRHVRSLNDWDAEDRDSYRKLGIAARPVDRDWLLNQRFNLLTSFTVRYASGPFTVTAPEEWLEGHLPFYSEPVESFRYQRYQRRDTIPGKQPLSVDCDLSTTLPASPSSIVALVLFVAISVFGFRFTLRSLFWPGISHRPLPLPAGQDERSFAVLLVPTSSEKRMLMKWFEPATAAAAVVSGAPGEPARTAGAKVKVLDFEDEWRDTGRRQTMLERLENARDGERTLILTEDDPLVALTDEDRDDESVPAYGLPNAERKRWIGIFRSSRGMAPAVFLQNAEDERFQAVWRSCSAAEQLTLIEVAQEGFANRHRGQAVQRLLDIGLLQMSPELNLGVPGWRDFVLEQPIPTEMKRIERGQGRLGWRSIRWIFLILLIIAMLFAVITGASWIKSATAMMSVLGGVMETVWKILSAVHKIGSPEGE